MFESDPVDAPAYASALRRFRLLRARDRAPRRPGAPRASGWSFDIFFCEAPRYLAFLFSLYEALGGSVELVPRSAAGAMIGRGPSGAHVVVVCAG